MLMCILFCFLFSSNASSTEVGFNFFAGCDITPTGATFCDNPAAAIAAAPAFCASLYVLLLLLLLLLLSLLFIGFV